MVENYCRARSITQADFAKVIDVKPGSLSRIKAGKGCSIETLAKIAALSNSDLKDLLYEIPERVRSEMSAHSKGFLECPEKMTSDVNFA